MNWLMLSGHAQNDQAFIQTDALVLGFLDLVYWQLLTGRERHDQRHKMVQLAASTSTISESARRVIPCIDSQKLVRMWRVA